MDNKRGQSVIEFMAGYGWILLVITISLISIIWTVSNDEAIFVKETCEFIPGIYCDDVKVDESSVTFVVKNNIDWDLDSIEFSHVDCEINSSNDSLKQGEFKHFTLSNCDFNDLDVFENNNMVMSYKLEGVSNNNEKAVNLISVVEKGNSQNFGGDGGGSGGNGGSGGGYNNDGATILLYKFDEGTENLISDSSVFGNSGTYFSDAEMALDGDAESGTNDSFSFLSVSNDARSGIYSFGQLGNSNYQVKSTEFLEIDMDKQYNLEGWFKSVGSSGQSKIYFGYVPYDKDYVIIKNEEVHPILNTETTLFNDVNSSDTVVNITDGSGWDKTIWHSRIAFEIDDSGNYLDLPNRELSNRLGSDSSLGIPPEIVDMGDHWEVRLYDLSVGKSYPAGTKVRQHKSGGTYIYDGGSGFVPNDWTKYSGTTQGEMTYLGDGSGNDWRTGTKYAKIMVLPNHGQSPDSGYDLRIDDISLTTIPPTYDYRWGSGVYGSALEFNGVDEYMIVPMDNFPTDELTVEFWMKSSDNDNDGTAFSYATSSASNAFLIFDYGNFQFWINNQWSGYTGVSANDGNWHHIAVTWRSSDGNVTMYKDGVNVYSGIISKGNPIISSGILVIGQEQDSLGGNFDHTQAFEGLIDEVRISDYVRY